MSEGYGWKVSGKEKEKMIVALTAELAGLRASAGISQEELSEMIGVSRQTYGSIERHTKQMSWSSFLALVLFFDYNEHTHFRLRQIQPIHSLLYQRFNEQMDVEAFAVDLFSDERANSILNKLDEQALHAIRTMIMIEYARCTATPGDVVIKAFDGVDFTPSRVLDDYAIKKALQTIKKERADK